MTRLSQETTKDASRAYVGFAIESSRFTELASTIFLATHNKSEVDLDRFEVMLEHACETLSKMNSRVAALLSSFTEMLRQLQSE